jgi:hypothetical protein
MWEGLDLFNLHTSKAQELVGWQCQETGVLIGNPIPISMPNLCPSGSPLLMEKPNCSKTSCHQIGLLAKPSLALYNSAENVQLRHMQFRVQGLGQRRAYYFPEAARHSFSDRLMRWLPAYSSGWRLR